MASTAGPSIDQLNAPYTQRWELLKDIMVRLFMEEGKQYKEIVKIMESEYKFYATEKQYKRQFGLWKVKRALPMEKKMKIGKEMETRAQQGKASVVLHKGKDENQKMRRFMKEQARREISIWGGSVDIENLSGHALQTGNRIFINWNLPSAILRALNSKAADHISPSFSVGTPMSGVLIATPSNSGPSPRNPPSPSNALSPNKEGSAMAATVKESLKINRAHLLVQTNHKDLLRGMNLEEQCIVTDWMHQFWQHSFVTAKNWGQGPRIWDASTLKFNQFSHQGIRSLPGTPAMNIDSPVDHSQYHQSPKQSGPSRNHLPKPSDLCCWSIHVLDEVEYEAINSPEPMEQQLDPDDRDTWRPWHPPKDIHAFAESFHETLENNKFSTVEVKELPISAGQIIRALKRSPEQMLEEAFGFAIMARNPKLVNDMITHLHENRQLKFHNLYPLHLVASYLDGAKSCCNIFSSLVYGMSIGESSVRKLYTNHLNHTILDNLMLSILKAHTSCTPGMVDDAFKKEHRFAGEEVDICGRWDADSDCIRHLQANGCPTIPQDWKHMFCHTSAQTITHCIGAMFVPHWGPDINTTSGLFLKRCPNESCGMKLQLKPLHTLVVTAFYLAQLGCDGETLFGMLACLLGLLANGADPTLKADISPLLIIDGDTSSECSHLKLDPFELTEHVPHELVSSWPQSRQVGWRILCHVLWLSRKEWLESTSDDDLEVEFPLFCTSHEREIYFSQNQTLVTLWAAVQTEMLTYRRLAEGDPWISANFEMASVLESLKTGNELSIGLVSKQLMNPFCVCGTFGKWSDSACLRVEEACSHYISNLEDWGRSNFLDVPRSSEL